jgi:YggT family protein
LRRVIPGYGGIDFASLALALIVHLILAAAIVTLAGASVANMLGHLLIWCLISLAGLFVKIFFFALIVNVILSWVAPGSHNPGAQLVRQIIEPLLKPIQRMLPDLGGIDISPIFAFLALNLVDMFVIKNLAVQTGMWTIISPFL